MKKLLLVPMLLLMTACATLGIGGLSPPQRLYQAHGAYNVVLGAAVSYAETPNANAGIVKQATAINREVAPAFVYAEQVVLCRSVDQASENWAAYGCDKLDTTANALIRNASLLEQARKKLLALLNRRQ